jgi:Putative enzyme of poly-gamma-glutamate biosynthesis (capsule formation)
MKIFKIILFTIFMIFFMVSCYFFTKEFSNGEIKLIENKSKQKQKETKKEYKLSLFMVGDALYHSAVYGDGKQADGTYNYDKQLEYIKPIASKYDLVYYNQESILGGTKMGLSSYPMFNSPQEVGDAFIKAGFNMVSLANNHTLDKGEKGVLSSNEYWNSKTNVVTAGSYSTPEDKAKSHVHEKNNIKYAFLSYTTLTNGLKAPTGKEYYVNVYDKEKVKADVEAVKNDVDVVMIAMHWGEEYVHTPTANQKEIAQYLSELGVDIIIGSHPHVVQPIEKIGNTVVIYSLGNFMSSQRETNKRVGLMATLNINKTVENGESTVDISDVSGDLVYTYFNSNLKNFKAIPFYKLTNEYLSGHETIKTKYEAIINQNDETIIVGAMQD